MRLREMEALLVALGHSNPSDMDARMRTLRARNLLPHGARGLHAPTITAEHLARGLIAVLGTGVATRAAMVVERSYSILENGTGIPFPDFLESVLRNLDACKSYSELRFDRSNDCVWAIYIKGNGSRKFCLAADLARSKSMIRDEGSISGEGLLALATAWRRQPGQEVGPV